MAVVFAACLVRATFGFGEALIAMPLLTMVVGVQIAAPLIALLSITLAMVILVRDWREVQWRSAWQLIVSSLVGIPIGLYCLEAIPESLVEVILASVILAFSIYSLARPGHLSLSNDNTAPLFGFLAGMLGGAYNTHGVCLAVYGTLRQWPPGSFRATLQGFFVPTSVLIVAGHVLSNRLTAQVLSFYLFSLPMAGVALVLGSWFSRRALAVHFARWLHVVLIVIGLSLLAHSCSPILGG